ncbi:MAG TPA: hydrogenase maturation nickel metallochaperone HypA [Roseiflexaceae bacterium]|nr:hydrogenase maturation nickel metallochaperone HypA [Roseiflexaceae bacterium]HMP42312.1 hydrogenase maturation nickel metallochaperone HypA [Roseiflexaceae bacterium]
MHEIGMLQDAVDLAIEQASAHGMRRIEQMTFRIGVDSGVVPDVIEFAFDVITKETIAAGARLVIEPVPLGYTCRRCNCEYTVDCTTTAPICPQCDGRDLVVSQGREFVLHSVQGA